ncbi:MAG TPA: FAD-linked oxidase C-terminal domain-containing protein [Symbiobacteriaceae bacterium]|nr:FAD-linked oxidase C-terminal domain-containing protein [Symbiobacteriaceae bacterium]
MAAPILTEIVQTLGKERVLTAPEDLVAYSYDGTFVRQRPLAVVMVQTTAEVQAVLAAASRHRTPVVPRGAGTGLSGGSVPVAGSVVLNLAPMNQIVTIDRRDMVAVVQPGVVTATLQAEVEKLGMFYPPDPSSLHMSTIGGNVAENAGGPRCLKYGVTGDYVMALEVVLADGRVMRTGSRALKNVTGYDLTHLIVGSEGTLGVVTEVTLRLLPKPPGRRTIMAIYADVEDSARSVGAILDQGIVPLTTELMDRAALAVVESFLKMGLPIHADAVLVIDIEGEPAVAAAGAEKVAEACRTCGAIDVKVAASEAEAEQLWGARRSVSAAMARLRPNKLGEDISVPRSALPAMVRAVRAIAARLDLVIPLFGHIGDGNLHPNILCDRRNAEEMERVYQAAEQIFQAAIGLGGTLSGEHGIGLLKKRYLPLDLGPVEIEVMKALKQTMDPLNILNPGKIFPDEGGL